MRMILTPDDLKKGEGLPIGWYPAEIFDYKEEVTKGSAEKPSDGSMNAIIYFRVFNPADPNAKPRELRRYFNEKALGFGKNLWVILFGLDKVKGGEINLEKEYLIGKKMMVYIKKNQQGYDNIEDWRPIEGAK